RTCWLSGMSSKRRYSSPLYSKIGHYCSVHNVPAYRPSRSGLREADEKAAQSSGRGAQKAEKTEEKELNKLLAIDNSMHYVQFHEPAASRQTRQNHPATLRG